MRGATAATLQHHQILRLPRKVTLIIDPCQIWNAIYIARSNTCHCPTSPNTAPATKSECHVILFRHETLVTMRGATSVIVQTHQILPLPRKVTLIIDPCHIWIIWNAIYNARSNSCHWPTSPNTAPAMKNDNPKCERNLMKTDETSFTARERSETVPSMIRAWSDHDQSATRLATEVTFHAQHDHFVLKNKTFRAPAIPNFTEYCACHEKWQFNFTKCCACHERWLSWSILVTYATLLTMRGATAVIDQPHEILRLPKMPIQNMREI